VPKLTLKNLGPEMILKQKYPGITTQPGNTYAECRDA
jgi:hypothetical protein